MKKDINTIPQAITRIGDYTCQYLLSANSGQAKQRVFLVSKNKQMFAAKIFYDQKAWETQSNFLCYLKQIHHQNSKNIINMIESNITERVFQKRQQQNVQNPSQQDFVSMWPVIIMEFAQMGQLFTLIKRTGRFPEQVCRTIFQTLINTLQYIHIEGISHRDIKPQNLLFDKNFQLKIADFGLATFSQGVQGDGILNSKVGTKYYWAPEVHKRRYNALQSDLFSAGIILFIMCTKCPPFMSTLQNDENYKYYMLQDEKRMHQYWQKVGRCMKKSQILSDDLKDLFEKMFRLDPSRRLTIQQIRNCQWMKRPKASQQQVKQILRKRHQKLTQKSKTKQKIQQIISKITKDQQQQVKPNRGIQQYFQQLKYLDAIQPITANQYGMVGVNANLSFFVGWIMESMTEMKGKYLKPKQLLLEQVQIDDSFCTLRQESLQIQWNLYLRSQYQIYNINITSKIQKQQKLNKTHKNEQKLCVRWKIQQGNQFLANWFISELKQQIEMLS